MPHVSRAALFIGLSIALVSPSLEARTKNNALVNAVRVADSADILLVREDLHFVADLNPKDVRELSCRYTIKRTSKTWGSLVDILKKVEPYSNVMSNEKDLRIGLVLRSANTELASVFAQPSSASQEVPISGVINGKWQQVDQDLVPALKRIALRETGVPSSSAAGPPLCVKG